MKNKNVLYMNIFVGSMIIVSLLTAWIMAKNLNKDDSKERFKLTKDYKKYKDFDYTYDEKKGKDLYVAMCLKCHGAAGLGTHKGPNLSTSEIVKKGDDLLNTLVRGKGRMPSYRMIGHVDLTHVANYIQQKISQNQKELITPLNVVVKKVDSIGKGSLSKEDQK